MPICGVISDEGRQVLWRRCGTYPFPDIQGEFARHPPRQPQTGENVGALRDCQHGYDKGRNEDATSRHEIRPVDFSGHSFRGSFLLLHQRHCRLGSLYPSELLFGVRLFDAFLVRLVGLGVLFVGRGVGPHELGKVLILG